MGNKELCTVCNCQSHSLKVRQLLQLSDRTEGQNLLIQADHTGRVRGVHKHTTCRHTHTHTQVQASQHCLICCCSITGNWIWITDVSLRFKPLTLSKIVGHLLCQPLHGSNAQFSAIVSVKGCWHSTLLISEKRHQKTFKFFKNSNAASLFISE